MGVWIATKNRTEAFDSSKMYSLFVVNGNGCVEAAVRCAFDNGQKAMTLGTYTTTDAAEAVLMELLDAIARVSTCGEAVGVIYMPDDRRASELRDKRLTWITKERAANGKKPVRRGGS